MTTQPPAPAHPAPTPADAAHEAMVAALRRPGACGGFPGVAQRLDTHLSTLLLAGDRVFKLKKPRRFGFVDFSTVAARRDACQQELRLNRRTAPRHYLAVVPVRATAAGAVIDPLHGVGSAATAHTAEPTGAVLDWAVAMRRFDPSQGFDHLADAGTLTRAQVDALATTVARFHAQLPPAPPGHGRPEAALHWARENGLELHALVQADPALAHLAEPLAALQAWSATRGAALAPLMAQRARAGQVREVHGDLHLGNIVWDDGAPLLFDALEFNDLLRHTDTIGDLAFTVMDLLAHGLPALAWRFLSQVLEASGDHAALPLLGWWGAYRAAVRAKVALLTGGPGAVARATACLQVASGLAGLAPPPPAALPPRRLVVCMGYSGSGKSTVALGLVERLARGCGPGLGGALRLRSDVERKRLHGLQAGQRAGPDVYSADTNRRTYQRLGELAGGVLGAGLSVVVDAACLRRAERQALREVAGAHGAAHTLLLCDAPWPVLQARVAARLAAGTDASDATPAVLELQRAVAEWPAADEATDRLTLDTDVPPDALAAAVAQLPLLPA
jgi:aminoglycoside phosphotransferase family enzyme/predicted kinase